MKTLYFICAYSHSANEWRRFLVSADSREQADKDVDGDLAPGWRIRSRQLICQTPDEIFKEV